MMDNLRPKHRDIFIDLTGVDLNILASNNLGRIHDDPVIKWLVSTISMSGHQKKWPDLFYRSDKAGNIKHLFRVPWLPRVSAFECYPEDRMDQTRSQTILICTRWLRSMLNR